MQDDAIERLDSLIERLRDLALRAGDDDVITLTDKDGALLRETIAELMRLYRQRNGLTDRLS